MQRVKRSSARLLVLARRARKIAKGHSGIVADLYHEHAAICESKAVVEEKEKRGASMHRSK
jgi:hypothetical protein